MKKYSTKKNKVQEQRQYVPKFELWQSNAPVSLCVVEQIVHEGVLENLTEALYDLEVGKKQVGYNLENSLELSSKVNIISLTC